MKILGVDIGSYSIKIAELDANAKGYAIAGFFELPLSIDLTRDRSLQIIELLRSVSSNYDQASTQWVIGVPQDRLSVRFKTFPFRERAKISKSLAFELEDDIPFHIEDTVFDYKIVEFLGARANVLTVAAPKEEVKGILAVAKDGGFDPSIVSVESLALANVFENWNASPREMNEAASLKLKDPDVPLSDMPSADLIEPAFARAILHIGHSRTLLLIYREGCLVAVRSILWGGGEIAINLARAFKIPVHEAMKLLSSKSFILMNSAGASKDQITMSEAVASQVDHLISEVRLTLLEVKPAFHIQIEQIELSGGVSQIQNLGAYLTQGLEIPANINTNAISGKPARFDVTPYVEMVAPVAVGLALEALKKNRNPAINLRKDEFARENRSLKLFWDRWRVPAQIAVSAFVLFFVYAVIRDQVAATLSASADDKVAEAAKTAANLKGQAASDAGISKYLKAQRDRISHQESVAQLDEYISAVDILTKISDKFPGKVAGGQDVDIVSIDIADGDVVLKGRAHSAAQIAQVQKGLSEIAKAQSLSTIPALDVSGGMPFGFKLKVSRKKL